jgi:hypothetical protein
LAEWWDDPDLNSQPTNSVTVKLPPATKATPEQEARFAPRGPWERFKDSYMSGALHSPFGGEGLARLYLKHVEGHTDEEINAAEKRMSDELARKAAADPVRQGTFRSQGDATIGRGAVDLLGNILGGADPTYAIGGPGKSVAARVITQGGINAGMDTVSQEVEIHRKVRDKFDPWEVGLNAAAGAVIQGGGEFVRSARTGHMIREGMSHPDWKSVNDVIVGDLEGGGTLSNPKVSRKGAVGPQQVMPDTARDPGFGIKPWNGKTQADLARVGRQYSAAMMSKYDGDTAKVLAAYNGGPGRVDKAIRKHGENWFEYLPNETKDYVSKGMTRLGSSANDNRTFNRGFPRPGGGVERPTFPDDLGEVDLVRQEQPSLEEQSKIIQGLGPQEEASNILPFPEHRAGYSPDAAANIRADDIHAAFDRGEITPAERQEMDASVDPSRLKPTDNYNDRFTGPVQDRAAANDPVEVADRSVLQTLKDLWHDESGSIPGGKDGETPSETPEGSTSHGPVDKLRQALKEAKPLREEQERQYSQERSARASKLAEVQAKTSGEAGFHAELGSLKGALPKVGYESIRGNFSQDDLDHLFNLVKDSPRLTGYDKISAREGLGKMLGAAGENFGAVPTNSEIKLLSRVLPRDIIDELMSKRPFHDKFGDHLANALNIPRALMASFDLSAPLRQGVVFVGRKEFYSSFIKMFHQFGSEKAFKAVQDEIVSRPTFGLMQKAKLSLTGMDHFLTDREEAFMSDWAEKIPLVGRGVHASNRAYVGFLNKLRADVFDSLVKQAKAGGIDFTENPKALKDIGAFINNATGRGNLGRFTQSAPLLNAALFSPRLMASRIAMLNPVTYVKMDPFVRKEAIKSMLSFGAIAMTVVGLAKMGGASVEIDPRSSDFGKIRVGNTRFDISGGFQPYVRVFAQLVSGKAKNSNTGEVKSLTSGKFGADTRGSKALDFLRSKESPMASLVDDLLSYPRTRFGQDVTVKNEVAPLFIPLIIQDTHDAVKEYGAKGLLVGVPGVFGVGVQTYKAKPKKSRTSKKDWWDDMNSSGQTSHKKEWWDQ